MNKDYVFPREALRKLKAARSFYHTVYIYASTGYGKTELVKQYLQNRKYTYISCANGSWDPEELPEQKTWERKAARSVVVIDDLYLLKNGEEQKEILELVERKDIWLILISRSPVPVWLVPVYIRTGFLVIGEESLRLNEKEIAEFFSHYDVKVNDAQLSQLAKNSKGNAYVLGLAARLISGGYQPGPQMYREATDLFAEYLECTVFSQWEPEITEFFMQVSVVDEFTVPLAEMITGNHHVARMLQVASGIGNFLSEKDGIYQLRPVFLQILRQRAEIAYGSAAVREYAYNAGLYYEVHDQIPQALAMYEKSGHANRIRELLIRNARRNPGNGHYFELRKYYLRLEEEEIGDNAVLMAAMSMVYSLVMQPEKSEYWYERLKTYEAAAQGGEKREAKSRLLYLDIALPHRGSQGLLHIFKRIPTILFDKGIELPEFSVTSNLPSTMNGGKDFCHWSKYDRKLAASIGKLMERILGRYGKGIVGAALGESLYEKGADTYEVLTLLARAEMECAGGGMPEMSFAIVGIKVRLYMLKGDIETAKLQLQSFEKRVQDDNVVQLLPNIEALKCRIALYEGDKAAVSRWMAEAPDENQEFYILERYRYLTKVRCYISIGDEMKALDLLEKLRYYAEQYKRTYIGMEVRLLSAIARERQEIDWKPDLMSLLYEASEYKFIRLISEEGTAVSGMLRQVKQECLEDDRIDKQWFEQLLNETGEIAVRYPIYLRRQMPSELNFSENALAVLRLQAEGLSVKQIAEQIHIKPETVKYHTKENYRKLGVSSKADAVLAARNLNIL